MNNTKGRLTAREEIDRIFREVLPRNGMVVREEQIALSQNMLKAMDGERIALCDAGTGIGKTYSYLVAGVVFNKHAAVKAPVRISTSSIALQKTITEEYIPFLSDALLSAGFIDRPISTVVRKGKSNYICDKRFVRRVLQIRCEQKNPGQAQALLSLRHHLDFNDATNISAFDRKEVRVNSCRGCSTDCRYRRFVKESKSTGYTFQICNHNFLLADAIHKADGIESLLPECLAVVIDEAHKLPEAARQMFSMTFSQEQMADTLKDLRNERFMPAYSRLKQALKPIIEDLNAIPRPEDTNNAVYSVKGERRKLFTDAQKALLSIGRILVDEASGPLLAQMASMNKVFGLFTADTKTHICYASIRDDDKRGLSATASNIGQRLQSILWKTGKPIVLTSGTLAVGNDFSRFKDEVGLKGLKRPVLESVFSSPFDYMKKCLIYYPKNAVEPTDENTNGYLNDIAAKIEDLIYATHGHTLVLFTSYSAMSAVNSRLEARNLPFPLFPVRRNAERTIEQFRQSCNGVLLGTGALWEGMDFAGEIVSSLIIPRLPFSVPDPLGEAKRSSYISLDEYIRAVVVPDMQIKLRQGFGRAIRTEDDSCVVSILDGRALPGKRYNAAVKTALPECPVTQNINSVKAFMRAKKPRGYFGVAADEYKCAE